MLFRFFFSLTNLPGEVWEGFDHSSMKQWEERDTFIFLFENLKKNKKGKRKDKRTKYNKKLK